MSLTVQCASAVAMCLYRRQEEEGLDDEDSVWSTDERPVNNDDDSDTNSLRNNDGVLPWETAESMAQLQGLIDESDTGPYDAAKHELGW